MLKKMKTILVRARSTDSAIFKVADSLSRNGNDVTLLVWDRKSTLKNENCGNYTVKKFSLKAPQDTWKVFFYFPIWWIYEFLFLLKNDCDIIHACDLDTLFPAILVKMIKHKKLFYTIYDFYANNMPNMRPFALMDFIQSTVAWVEKFGIRFADVLFLVDECRYEEVKGAKINNVEYIYNSPPDSYKEPVDPHIKDKFTIFYAGLILKVRGLESILKSIEDIDSVKLVIGGIGTDVDMLEKLPAQMKSKVEYLGWIPTYDDVINKTMECDMLFRFSDPKIPKSKYESPNKLFEAMMCGKPIIINSELAASSIVRDEKCGIVVNYDDVNAIKNTIITLKNNRDLCKELGVNGRKAYENKYSWDIMEKRLLTFYNNYGDQINQEYTYRTVLRRVNEYLSGSYKNS